MISIKTIYFNYNQTYEYFLSYLLNNIEFTKYKFNILFSEIRKEEEKYTNYPIFKNKIIKGEDFKKIINKEKICISYLIIQIYKKEETIIIENTPSDLINNLAEAIIIISDITNIEIHFNNESLRTTIKNNLSNRKIKFKER